MNSVQKVLLVFAALSALVLYVVGWVFLEPPALAAKEPVTVVTSAVETRQAEPPSLPVIEIRDGQGAVTLLQGYRWMQSDDAIEIVDAAPAGAVLDARRWDGMLWRGLSGFVDWALLIVSLLAAFFAVFCLWMIVKLRPR